MKNRSRCSAQPRQYLESRITVSGHYASLNLEIVDRLHGILAHAAIGSIRIEAERCQTALNFLNFGESWRSLAARKLLHEPASAANPVARWHTARA